jgi:hypothetical protein
MVYRFALICAAVLWSTAAFAQPLGTFRWQLQPYCNVLTLSVARNGGVYTLDGFDDQCGAGTRAPVTGAAVPNPDGTIELGINIVTSPDAAPVHVAVPLNIATLAGTWRDSAANTGMFVFTPGAGAAGPPRPAASDSVPPSIVLRDDGGFLAGGSENAGAIPAHGAGTRMMWYPGKASFRAGAVSHAAWDEANVGRYSTALGRDTVASGHASTAIGEGSTASGEHSFAAGWNASASGNRSVAMGSGAIASGDRSVALGSSVSARGLGSVVLGTLAATTPSAGGSFVFGDAAGDTVLTAGSANQFLARATGGTRFFSNLALSAGVSLSAGASAWSSVSDVNMKEHFRDLDGEDVLAKLARMPIREWSYKAQDASIRHAGPTAQDFHDAFGLGEDRLRISTIDADGIALRAVQALEARTRAFDERIAELLDRIATLEAALDGRRH